MLNKKQGKLSFIGLAILVLVGFIAFTMFFSDNSNQLSVSQQDTLAAAEAVSCDGVSSVTYTLVDRDVENLGTTPSADARVYMADGSKVDKRIASGGTLALTPKVNHKALVGNGSATYYAQDTSFQTLCSNDDLIEDLANVGTLTLTARNNDDDQPNLVTDRTPLGQNEQDYEVVIKYDVSSNDYWGNPQAQGLSLVSCRFDTVDITSIKVADAASGSKPQIQTLSAANDDGGGADAYDSDNTYKIPNLVDGASNEITLLIDSVSGSNPGNGNFTCNFYDSNLDLNEETLEVIKGVEDEDFNLLSIGWTNITVHYS